MFHNLKDNPKFWRRLTNFWAIIVYLAVIYDFTTANGSQEYLGPLIAIYVAALAIYAGDKEFERWHYNHNEKHPGEIFIIAWTFLIVAITAIDFLFSLPYKMPSEVVSAYIAVLGVLAITKRSKSFYNEKIEK
jgi:uncharacterized membrane protein HdeD (DUF308 family)